MPTVDLPQGRVHYREFGPTDGPAVVLVHGLLVTGELWTQVAEALAGAGIRSVVPDLPLGAHPIALNDDADLSPRGVARLILDLLAALDLTHVTLVGNDTGGALCQFLIDADASRIGRLVLTNCDAFDQFPPPPFGLLVKLGRRAGRVRFMANSIRPKALRHSMLGYGGLVRDKLDPELTRRWITPALTDAGVRRDAARFMGAVDPQDLLDVSTRLGEFTKPVTLLWGNADRFFKLDFAHRLRDAFPDATLVEIEGAKTFVALDEPQRVAAGIRAACDVPR
ncbi:MAG TPA: alpha/beta hydrolase [Jatrophihabitans sp.]|uniref:alpha/beta fold hydrolase n=1 Tax=Jatrophihabitans sp. TaxID=1932789 RepID=UPI002E05F6FE|nr:alpha/beta hydrolase [Jatrophihabitans sp.]